MRDIRASCLLVSECDTPDEVRQVFDEVFAVLREHRAAIEAIQKPPTVEKTTAKKGGKK